MKKIIITLICIFALPILVNADMGAPETYNYEIVITKQDGVTAEGWDNKQVHIPYNTKLTVVFEYEKEGVLYLDVEYDGNYVAIKAEDAEVVEADIDWSFFWENKTNDQYYTLAEVELYKGPSKAYGKSNKKIPANKVVDYTHSSEEWAYVNYEGTKGWIYIYSYSFEGKPASYLANVAKKDQKVLILKDTKLYANAHSWTSTPDGYYEHTPDSSAVVADLKPGEYKILYDTVIIPHTHSYYVENGDTKGWLLVHFGYGMENTDPSEIISNKYKIISFDKDLEIYENLNDVEPVRGKVIPKMTELNGDYEFLISMDPDSYISKIAYRVQYEGKEYWIKGTDDVIRAVQYVSKFKLEKNLNIYKDFGSKEVAGTVPKGTELTLVYSKMGPDSMYWYYIEYKGTKGWVMSQELEYDESEIIQVADLEEQENPSEPTPEPSKPEDKKGLTATQIGLICCGAAVILTLTAVVSVILVNKNKKKAAQPVAPTPEAPPVQPAQTQQEPQIKVPTSTGVLPVVNEDENK